MFRTTVCPTEPLSIGGDCKSKFRCDYNTVPNRRESLSDEFLIGERAINFCRIEKRDASVHGGTQKRNHFLTISRRAVIALAHSHAAESNGCNLKSAFSQFSLLHRLSLAKVRSVSPIASS